MSIINVLDTEWDGKRLLEIGITTISTKGRCILKTYSLPVLTFTEISPAITKLTGWTQPKLAKYGLGYPEITRRLLKYGFQNRAVVMDTNNEFPEDHFFQGLMSPNRINVSLLFHIKTGSHENIGLDKMLAHYGLKFEGRRHRAADDSKNIARLFLKVMYD